MRRAATVVLALGLGACRAEQRAESPPSPDVATAAPAPATTSEPPEFTPRRPGVAHAAAIDDVVLSRDGMVALTRDSLGGIRLWPKLDGSEEPMVVPVRGAISMSVERHEDGFTVAIVEPAGGARVLRLTVDGTATDLAELVPFDALKELHVLSGGTELAALYADHRVVWMTDRGQELARFAERKFRPRSMQVVGDGHVLGLVIWEAMGAGGSQGEVQRISLKPGSKPSIERLGAPRVFETPALPSNVNVRLSPAGEQIALWQLEPKTNQWKLGVLDMKSEDGELFDASVSNPSAAALGWVDDRRVFASAPDGTIGWMIDVANGDAVPRTARLQQFGSASGARDVTGGRVAAGHGSWLYVQNIIDRDHAYLGYDVLQPHGAALSPTGRYAAWAYGNSEVHVEDLEGEHEPRKMMTSPNKGAVQLIFLGDDHLGFVDGWGGVDVYDWRQEEVVASGGANGGIRSMAFDAGRGLLALTRHNGDVRAFEVADDGSLAGPFIVPVSASQAGVYGRKAAGKDALWTIDSGKVLGFTMAELRGDLTRKMLDDKRDTAESLAQTPAAVGPDGAVYMMTWGSGQELNIELGDSKTKIPVGSASVTTVLPSPRAPAFAVTRQTGQQHSIAVYLSAKDEADWSFSTGSVATLAWSGDGTRLIVASPTGGVVLNASNGEIVQARCGFGFHARGSVPGHTAFATARPICEQH